MRLFKFEGMLASNDSDQTADELANEIKDFLDSDEMYSGVQVTAAVQISPEAIQKARDVLKAVAPTTLTDHDKQILEVAAGILEGVGERNT